MLQWTTPAGSVANLLIGVPASVILQAIDTKDYGNNTITYQLVYGTLPTGITLNSHGVLSGTPVYSNINDNYFTSRTYSVIVRANAIVEGVAVVADRTFDIIISNTINQDFSWITPAGLLGTIPEGDFYALQLEAVSLNNTAIVYSFVSGELPTGVQLLPSGLLQGVPTLLTATSVAKNQDFRFTIRATNSVGHVTDRSFVISVTSVYGPVIRPTTTNLGTYFDGTYFSQQLTVQELNPSVQIQWSIVNPVKYPLPPGMMLSSTGLLSGYIQPVVLTGAFGPAGFDGDSITQGIITQQQEFDHAPYDFNQLSQNINYKFTIQAYDGANYDTQDYVVQIQSRPGWTADNGVAAGVNDNILTVDQTNIYLPVILNSSTTLPAGRQNSYYAYKFDGFDFDASTITYSITDTAGTFDADPFDALQRDDDNNRLPGSFDVVSTSTANLPGLILDSQSGWIYGKIQPQTAAIKVYTFGITVTKNVNGINYSGRSVTFNLPVLGDINNIIEWITPANLGSIDNGSTSELSIVAKSILGKELQYSIYDYPGLPARLPQGLSLLPTGEISGRVSFEAFNVDEYTTTFDKNLTTIDRVSTFTVQASTVDGTATTYQEFTLKLNIIDKVPYVDLYLKAMPAFDQRQIYNSIVNNTEIFDPNLIYRPTDPWFGVRPNIEMLFVPGLNSETLDAYEQAIRLNHWTKRYNFNSIKSAVVLDRNYKIKYEVVYIDMLDPEENSAGNGAPLELDLTSTIANPYIDAAGINHTVLYPNSTENMLKRLESNVGYADQSSLPPWMTSNQPTATANTFDPPLGFTKAIVLAYTIPGASKLIAYRLKNAGITFNGINFTVDRYEADTYYSTNFNPVTQRYLGGIETTFDTQPKDNIGAIIAKVDYAVTVPFTEINGRTINYINSNGGIDGVLVDPNTFSERTLIFAKQENFLNAGPYDGWIDYFDGFIGDNITTTQIEGFGGEPGSGSLPYDDYVLVPGYLENSQTSSSYYADGATRTFTISPGSSRTEIKVYIDNVLQDTNTYSINGSQLTFNVAPQVIVKPNTPAQIVLINGANEQTVLGDGATTSFNISPTVAANPIVSVNGTATDPGTYNISTEVIAAVSFVPGYIYQITSVGTTDFTAIGAKSNNPNSIFVATGPGPGTGTATATNIIFNTAPTTTPLPVIQPLISIRSSANQRGSVWQINIVNNIVYLTSILEIAVNDRVQIISGKNYTGSILHYVAPTLAGQTVPYYETFLLSKVAIQKPTTFNSGTTKFFNNRDQYYVPNSKDKYLKFPQIGVFN